MMSREKVGNGNSVATIRFNRRLSAVFLANQVQGTRISKEGAANPSRESSTERMPNTGLNHIRQMIEAVESRLKELERSRDDWMESTRKWVIELALAATSKVLFREIQTGDYPLEKIVAEMIERTSACEPITVSVNPIDLGLIESARKTDESSNGDSSDAPVLDSKVRWVARPQLERGSVILDGSQLSFFHSPQMQLDEIRQSLLEPES